MSRRTVRSASFGSLRDVASLELDAAARDVDEPQQRAPGRRFAAARFADQRERLAGCEIEAHLLDRVHAAAHAAEQSGLDVEARQSRTRSTAQDRRAIAGSCRECFMSCQWRCGRVVPAVVRRRRSGRSRGMLDDRRRGSPAAALPSPAPKISAGHLRPASAELRHGGKQRARVRVRGRLENRFGGAFLDLLAAIHHDARGRRLRRPRPCRA